MDCMADVGAASVGPPNRNAKGIIKLEKSKRGKMYESLVLHNNQE